MGTGMSGGTASTQAGYGSFSNGTDAKVYWNTIDPYGGPWNESEEKTTLKMKEELTLCSEKLWN